MSFATTLQHYLDLLGANAKELSGAADVSPSALSRYLSGERVPQQQSNAPAKLARGIVALARAKHIDGLDDEDEIACLLAKEISGLDVDYPTFARNFQNLITTLDISSNALARSLNFDPSYISRILRGQRKPGNLVRFMTGVANYIARNYADSVHAPLIASLADCTIEEALSQDDCFRAVLHYLGSDSVETASPLTGFLTKLDEFDLNEYIKVIHFDTLKVPTAPLQLPTTKTYTGIEEMMQAELDFLKAAVLSKSTEDIILYSDMPLGEMAQDSDFVKKWMLGLAMALKKGLHLQNIHDVYRPIDEMAMGLEAWIPLYMTGQMTSYYLKEPTNRSFLHFIRSAGTVAVSGEAIAGHQGQGRYIVTKNKDDVAYYRTRAELLLNSAKPLMRTFGEDQTDELAQIIEDIHSSEGASDEDLLTIGEGVFHNIAITVLPGRYALITKNNPPAMAFLIEHPFMVNAIEQFEPPITDANPA